MGYLKAYAAVMVLVALVAAVSEMLLQGTPYQKYVKVVVGLMMIVAVLMPISDLTGLEFQLEDYSYAAQEDYEQVYQDALDEQYHQTLAETLQQRLEQEGAPGCEAEIETDEDENSPDYRRVLSVQIRRPDGPADEARMRQTAAELFGVDVSRVTIEVGRRAEETE